MEITQERIEREFNIEIVATAPNVTYKLTLTNGEKVDLENPTQFPDVVKIESMEEPFMGLSIICPNQYMGGHYGTGA